MQVDNGSSWVVHACESSVFLSPPPLLAAQIVIDGVLPLLLRLLMVPLLLTKVPSSPLLPALRERSLRLIFLGN